MAEKKEKKYVSDNAQLMAEWDWEKNNELGFDPTKLTCGSRKQVWWKCKNGHEWNSSISNRNKGNNCPYCSGKKVLIGYNDLKTINPKLANEWHYEKNGDLTPEKFTANSGKKVWWKCTKEHEWQASIIDRNKGNGCRICNSEKQTSFPEYAIEYYLKKYGLDVIHTYIEKGYELDVYIPAKNVAIEYDGYFWHKNRTKNDIEKNKRCQKDGIRLYRIRERLPSLNGSSIDYIIQQNQNDLSQAISDILSQILGFPIDVDIKRDTIEIENLREYSEKENSLIFTNSQLANEWNFIKNGNLKPLDFASNSGKKVWWKCSNGHEWQATIDHRNKGTNCPYCSGTKVFKGYNDLQTSNPTLALEWNYQKNGILMPSNFTSHSGKKVWWKCNNGHEWQATIASRNDGKGCPYCSGRYVIEGKSDLQTSNPKLAKQWNYEKNSGVMPTDVTANSHRKVWWKCSNGHEWQAIIANRNKRGDGCPECTKSRRKNGKV